MMKSQNVNTFLILCDKKHAKCSRTAVAGYHAAGTAPKQEEQEKKTVANEHKDKDSALSYAERKEQQKKISRIQKQVKESEKRIEDMEAKLEELGKQLEQPENASDMTLVNKYTELQSALDEEMQKWEELSLQLE